MARRAIAIEPVTRLAVWARGLALFALAAAIIAIIVVRSGALDIIPALATFGGALVVAAIAIVVAAASLVVIWKDGARGLGSTLIAIAIAIALLAYPAYLAMLAYKLPRITDVTTDTVDPPRYEVLARVRPRDANPVAYPGAAVAAAQQTAYSDIEPYVVPMTPQAAYDATLAVINKRRWRIVDERPPQPGRRDGHIEAVARTPIMGFREDVVVRVRAENGGARVDARSSSRYGPLDFGGNAARIRALIESIDETLSAKPPPKPVPTTPAKPATPGRPQADRR
jgi:uncharacterized protein (DUF1499 family)